MNQTIEEATIVRDIKVGDTIRSYDFHNMKNYYMEGVVEYIRHGYYICRGTRTHRDGVEKPVIDFHTPITSCFDWDGRIEVL